MRRAYFQHFLLLNLALAGCTVVGPTYEKPPEMDIPGEWSCAESSETMPSDEVECFVWWEALNDPILNSLIKRATKQNLDMLIAGTRILAAREEEKGKTSDLYPHVDASVTTGHAYYSKQALVNGVLGAIPARHRHFKRNVNFFEMGFDASWEIDLFGHTEHEINAAKAKMESAEANLYDVWVTLTAEIAKNYIELRSLQQRRELINKNIDAQKLRLHLIKELLMIGTASDIDLSQAEESLNNLAAEKPQIALAIDRAIHRLSILLAQNPRELFTELSPAHPLPAIPCQKPLGLPSELLRRRPDIRRAERDLAAATELVGSAVAALFPRISLYGFIGDISTQLHSLTSGSSGTWFAAPQLLMPIFNSKLLTQDVNLSKVQAQQALFTYQKTVLEALEEVENSIAAFRYESERNHSLEQAESSRHRSYELTMQLYERGVEDYLKVLNTIHTLLAAKENFIQSQTDLLLHYISLYKALGGGWDIALHGDKETRDSSCSSLD